MTRRERRRPAALSRGKCPICGACLGVPPVASPNGGFLPPSLRLELSGPARETPKAWRLSVVGRDVARSSQNPPFDPGDVQWAYLLCGNGHFFLDRVSMPGEPESFRWSEQSFVAAVGPAASGKSYLITRTLNQPLVPPTLAIPHLPRVEVGDPLESVPRSTLERYYNRTRSKPAHTPIPATVVRELIPGGILGDYVDRAIPDVATELQEQVMGGARSGTWGTTVRQPIFVRTGGPDGRVLTCVADLAGELFHWGDQGFEGADTLQLLRWCDALLWVVDPFASDEFLELLEDAVEDHTVYQKVMRGSSRPGEYAGSAEYEDINRERGAHAGKLAQALTADVGQMAADRDGTLHNLVAITKCDVLRLALEHKALAELGNTETVVSGVMRYLEYVSGPNRPAHAQGTERLLTYLCPTSLQDRVRRARHVAEGLVAHYSDPKAFWDLVHTGRSAVVRLANPDRDPTLAPLTIAVPSIDDHLAASLVRHGAAHLQPRDLVMSALGCGVMFGLGQGQQVQQLLGQTWRQLRFFLCSPLATVPLADDGNRLSPTARNFPRVDAPSAALTQLQLRILMEALPS